MREMILYPDFVANLEVGGRCSAILVALALLVTTHDDGAPALLSLGIACSLFLRNWLIVKQWLSLRIAFSRKQSIFRQRKSLTFVFWDEDVSISYR